eukprot:2811615-Pyramimonas_sp.AAC.1
MQAGSTAGQRVVQEGVAKPRNARLWPPQPVELAAQERLVDRRVQGGGRVAGRRRRGVEAGAPRVGARVSSRGAGHARRTVGGIELRGDPPDGHRHVPKDA